MRQKTSCRKLTKVLFALFLLLGASGLSVQAVTVPKAEVTQQKKVVKGTVVDENGEAIPGASVVVKGQTSGVISDVDGNFSLSVPSSNSTIVVSFVGCKTKEIALAGRTNIKVVMESSVEQLKEVVVTALGIKREKKALGYAVQDVKNDQLTKVGSTGLTDALQGKVAGLNISDSGTGAGGSSKVVIRGNSSLVGNDAPLWVVDGVPYDTGIDTGNMQWGGFDRAGGAYDLNPEDVESISVLKGPTAAALYGSRAGNGVIMVTTKKGGKNGRIGINYTGKFTVSKVAYSLDEQDTYGQGSNGQFVSSSDLSWGAKMTGQSIPAWWDKSQTTTYEVQKDVMKNFYRDGGVQSNAVSFQGGDKDNPFRITLSHDYTKGNVRYNSITRTDFDVVSHYKLTDFLSFDVKADYTNTKGLNRPTLGLYGSTYYLYTMPRSIQLSDLSTYKFNPTDLAAGKTEAMNWFGPDANHQNPYFILEQWKNKDTKNRLFGYAAANVKLTPDLTFKLKQGLDIADTQYRYIYPFDDVVFGNYPASEMSKYTSKEMNTEFLLSYNKVFGDFQVGVSAGGNRMYSKTEGLIGKSGKMNIYGSHYLTLGTKPYVENTLYEKEINSLYAFANIGYKDFIYLDLTARNDWSSTLPSGKRSYFYPSASLSVLVTSWMDEMGINYNKKMINYGKIRASFAQVGKDTDPYQLLNTYGTTTDDAFGYLYTNEPTTLANTTLKPEIATSWELGTEWRLFDNRFGFDFTYYNTATKNQIVAVDQPITSGWLKKYENIGKITNKGIELALNGTVIRTNDMSLELTANIAHNKTKLVKLAEGVAYHKFDELNSTGSAMQLRAYPHGTFGEIYDYGFVRDDKGNIVVDAEGYPEKSGDLVKLGDIQPDFTGSFGLNYNYKGFNLSALFNFQKGGDIFSFTECEAARFGIAKCTENRESFVFDGVTESGAKNTTAITDVQKYWTNVPAEQFMHDASFLKLKELSLGYTFSKSFLNKYTNNIINSLKLSVFGSNLFYLVKHTPGTTPDNSAFSATVFAQAVDYAPLPNTRTFGLSVNVGF